MNQNWTKHEQGRSQHYINSDNDHTITIIKTGFKGTYFVVHDDPYEEWFGKIDTVNRQEIKELYGIELQI